MEPEQKELPGPFTDCDACNAPLWCSREEGPDVPQVIHIDGKAPFHNGCLMLCSTCMIDYQKSVPEKYVKLFEEKEYKFLIPNAIRSYHRQHHDTSLRDFQCKYCNHARSIWRKFYNIPEDD